MRSGRGWFVSVVTLGSLLLLFQNCSEDLGSSNDESHEGVAGQTLAAVPNFATTSVGLSYAINVTGGQPPYTYLVTPNLGLVSSAGVFQAGLQDGVVTVS